jgi:hypothetical protein
MFAAIGTTLPIFLGGTVVMMGFCAFLSGAGLANTWRPMWQVVPYALMLGLADRFFVWAIFGAKLFTLAGYVVDTAALGAIMALAYRLALARNMVRQYPWLYERSGPFSWRAAKAER